MDPVLLVGIRSEEIERRDTEFACDPLDGLKREVALPALHCAHVGAMDPEFVGECLLAQAPRDAPLPEPASDCGLHVADHDGESARVLLDGLHTDK